LTHEDPRYLLNFRFAPSSTHQEVRRSKVKRTPVFRKETFVQANYHFILCPGEYAQSLANPDHSVDWLAVELVYFPVTTIIQCPICLDPPIAPKLTKCGHVFCAPCILRYLSLSERNWSRCPLCFESVYQNALKSLDISPHAQCKENAIVEFQLIRRLKGSIIPIECGGGKEKEKEKERAAALTIKGCPLPYSQAHALARFARITVTNDITEIVNREKQELLGALKDSQGDQQHATFVQMALNVATERYEEWGQRWGFPRFPKETPPSPLQTTISSTEVLEKDAWETDVGETHNENKTKLDSMVTPKKR